MMELLSDIGVDADKADIGAVSRFRSFRMRKQPFVAGRHPAVLFTGRHKIRLLGIGASRQDHDHAETVRSVDCAGRVMQTGRVDLDRASLRYQESLNVGRVIFTVLNILLTSEDQDRVIRRDIDL